MRPRPDMIFVDPTDFVQADLPIVILCDDLRSAVGWIIKEHTSGNYNHSVVMRRPGKLISQNTLLREIPLSSYMNDYTMLKFWRIKNLTEADRKLIFDEIDGDLGLPWWRRLYDYLGIIGQALHLPGIQAPPLHYCSESVMRYLKVLPRFSKMPNQPSPAQLDSLFKANPDLMEPIGYYWPE